MSAITSPNVPLASDQTSQDLFLQGRLQSTRDAIVTSRWRTIRRSAVIAAICWLGLIAVLDCYWELAFSTRAACLLSLSGMILGGIWYARRRWITGISLDDAAAIAEQHDLRIGQRLRTALDYSRTQPIPAAADDLLLDKLRSEAQWAATRMVAWDSLINRRAARIAGALVALLLVACGICLLVSSDMRTAMARVILLPSEYTSVEVTPLDATIKSGESVKVEVNIAGRPLASALLRYRPRRAANETSATWTEAPLEPEEETDAQPAHYLGKFHASLTDLREDMEFQVIAGPREMPMGSIRVLPPLTLTALNAQVTPPAYLEKPSLTIEWKDTSDSPSDLPEVECPEGAQVTLRLQFNRPPQQATVGEIERGKDEEYPTDVKEPSSVVSSATPNADTRIVESTLEADVLTASLMDVRADRTLELSAVAADGIELESRRLRLRVRLDRKPRVEFVEPAETLEVLPTTEVRFQIRANDDHGLGKIGIMARVGEREEEVLIERDGEGTREPVEAAIDLLLEKYPVTFQEGVSYHAFAEDNYFGEVRRVTTPLRFIDIRPYEREFQKQEGGGSCNGCSTTLEELIVRQKDNLSRTFSAKNLARMPDEFRERLLTNETEILSATEELSAGFIANGAWIPEFDEAARSMQQAVEALKADDLPTAEKSQGEALRHLIRARQNVRKMLSDPQNASASQCRKFDQQQRQKLRTPEQRKEDEKREAAEIRSQLDKLAQQQRKWSEQVRSTCSNPSKSSKPSTSSSQSPNSSPSQSPAQSPSKPQPEASPSSESQQDQQQPSQSPSQSQPTPEALAEQQKALLDQFEQLQKRMAASPAPPAAGLEEAKRIAEAMQENAEQLQRGEAEQAGNQGERVAERLDQLSEHLHSSQTGDISNRLDSARRLAERIAARQRELSQDLGNEPSETSAAGAESLAGASQPSKTTKTTGNSNESAGENDKHDSRQPSKSLTGPEASEWASRQRGLADQTKLLEERLESLRAAAAAEKPGMSQALEEAQAGNSPAELAGDMREAASAAEKGKWESAARDAERASRDAQRLAQALNGLSRQLAQPQLDELMALEEQLAQLRREWERERREGESGAAAAKWRAMADKIGRLAQEDRRVAEALRRMASQGAIPNAPSPTPYQPGENGSPPQGFGSLEELKNFEYTPELAKVLQMKIQEAILAGAMQDADEPVPPEFRGLVDEYYRALSDDLSP